MTLNNFNTLRLEYSLGAKIVMFSLIDTSTFRNVLTSNNVSNIVIEYSINGNSYTYEKPLSFHINSCLMIIKDNIEQDSDIDFDVYIVYNEGGSEKYRIKLCDTIHEHTLLEGNIEFNIIPSSIIDDTSSLRNKIQSQKIFDYINDLGTRVTNENYNEFAQYAKVVPFKYNGAIATASAYYYQFEVDEQYGLIQSSGGSYFRNDVLFHEMRHRYGITGIYSHITRDQTDNRSASYSFIEDKFTILHNALKFETGRDDAKVWVFGAHSNICEGNYTNNGDYNYLAANYIKALVWYTCHDTDDTDDSKIRIIPELNLSLVSGDLESHEFNDNTENNDNNNNSNNEITPIELNTYSKQESNDIIKSYRKTINIGPYQYLYEYLKNGEDFNDIDYGDEFIILRNFEISNNIIYDKDIYFIQKSIYDQIKNNFETDLICYPLYNNRSLFFSNSYEYFNNYNISKLEDIHYDIFDENNEDNENKLSKILCDKLRIYNPTIKNDLNYIIYTDNYINNIHFHYICNTNNNYQKQYSKEIKVNNSRYIEYIEINVPNIKYLFSEKNKFYIKEDFNKITNTNLDIVNYLENNDKNYNDKLYLSDIIKPYFIDKIKKDNKEVYIKTYLNNNYFNFNNNYINTSVNVILYPYIGIENNLYILDSNIPYSSSFIEYESYFRLSSRLGFDNRIISLINEFIFPGKIKEDHDLSKLNTEEKINYINKFNTQVTDYYNTFFLHDNINDLEEHEDYDDDLDVENIRTTGYVIQFANDKDFKEIIWESSINTDNDNNNFIYDFSFSLNGLVDSWDQLNEILIVRTKFIDKRLNISIISNNVVITKEWFKYLINDTFTFQVDFNEQNNLITQNYMDINKGFNLIDHINCNIIENNNQEINTIIDNSINKQIIYKPIFYKVQDLQNIRIREGIVQNIGINLGEYLNKVSCFILNIDGQNIKESSRNDVYVIFKVNSNNIENNNGYYNILDDNFEYISSGNYIKY